MRGEVNEHRTLLFGHGLTCQSGNLGGTKQRCIHACMFNWGIELWIALVTYSGTLRSWSQAKAGERA